MDSRLESLAVVAQTQCVKNGIGPGSRHKGQVAKELIHAAICVEIHQVLPQGSLTPPRTSGSPGFCTGS
jgi:hypothetical protein